MVGSGLPLPLKLKSLWLNVLHLALPNVCAPTQSKKKKYLYDQITRNQCIKKDHRVVWCTKHFVLINTEKRSQRIERCNVDDLRFEPVTYR